MNDQTHESSAEPSVTKDSWVPMIALAQMLMSFNVVAIPVSMSGMVESFDMPPTAAGTAVVLYSLGVSAFILLGARLANRFGAKRIFHCGVLVLTAAMLAMVLSPTTAIMWASQAVAG
jgi:MFS family permease